jgi:hypothetical protein
MRYTSLALGIICTTLGCYGAFQYAYGLEKEVSYIVLAAPIVAVAAALIPPLAEASYKSGEYLKALLWLLILVPAGATVFYASAERVHIAKSFSVAERQAKRFAVERASTTLAEAKTAAKELRAKAYKTKRELVQTALAKADAWVVEKETALAKAQAAATTESELQAPPWLLPAALDLVAFIAIWTGLTGPKPSSENTMRVREKTKKTTEKKKPPELTVVSDLD